MKRTSSQHSGLTQRTEYNATNSDVDTTNSLKSMLSKNPLASTTTLNGLKPTESELLTNRSYRADSVKKNYESTFLKLSNMIQETFLEIKHQTVDNVSVFMSEIVPDSFLLERSLYADAEKVNPL